MTATRRDTIKYAGAAIAAMSGARANAATRAEDNAYAVRSGPMPMPYVPRRGYADGPFGQVHFRDTGGDGRPLILCPQAPMTSRQFENVYQPLASRGIRAIGVDSPGFGESDPTPFVPTASDWAEAVPAVLDHLNIEQADVLGHHTGSMVATEVALLFPERVNKLIVNGPLPVTEEERRTFLEFVEEREINFVYEADGSHMQDAFASRYRMYAEAGTSPDPKTITRYVVERFQGYAPFWTGHHAAFIYDHNNALLNVAAPTMILTNTGDQIYENAKLAARIRPDFTYVELAGGGIDIVDQMPEEWADAVDNFLAAPA
ncbi:alpha/beta fold hydrolase [Candidatus Foliamicus sp.]